MREPTTKDNAYSAFTQAGEIVWRSPRVLLGETEWRVTVYDHKRWSRCVGYEWRRSGHWMWRRDEDHPRYDSDDGQYAGLPKGLLKLYKEHALHINRLLREAREEAQEAS